MEALRQITAVGVVLGLLGGALWWLRRCGFVLPASRRQGALRRMESVERLALGPQQTLHLVRLGGRALVVASSPAGCVLLHTADWHEVAGESAP